MSILGASLWTVLHCNQGAICRRGREGLSPAGKMATPSGKRLEKEQPGSLYEVKTKLSAVLCCVIDDLGPVAYL